MSINTRKKANRSSLEPAKAQPMQPYLPRLLRGYSSMESSIIALHQRKWPISEIARLHNIKPTFVTEILTKYGQL